VGSRGGAGQEERRRGSPRKSGDGGAAGSGQHGDVPVGGWLRRGGGVLEVVLQLAVEAGKVAAGVVSERDEKHGAGGKNSADGGWQRPFKGGWRHMRGGGSGHSGDSAVAWRRAAAVLPRYSGGRRDAHGADASD
jgi:hypothetical protein